MMNYPKHMSMLRLICITAGTMLLSTTIPNFAVLKALLEPGSEQPQAMPAWQLVPG